VCSADRTAASASPPSTMSSGNSARRACTWWRRSRPPHPCVPWRSMFWACRDRFDMLGTNPRPISRAGMRAQRGNSLSRRMKSGGRSSRRFAGRARSGALDHGACSAAYTRTAIRGVSATLRRSSTDTRLSLSGVARMLARRHGHPGFARLMRRRQPATSRAPHRRCTASRAGSHCPQPVDAHREELDLSQSTSSRRAGEERSTLPMPARTPPGLHGGFPRLHLWKSHSRTASSRPRLGGITIRRR